MFGFISHFSAVVLLGCPPVSRSLALYSSFVNTEELKIVDLRAENVFFPTTPPVFGAHEREPSPHLPGTGLEGELPRMQ